MAPVRPAQASAPHEALKPQRLFSKISSFVFPCVLQYVQPRFCTLQPSCPLHPFPATGNPSHPRLDNNLALDVARDRIHWLKMAASSKPLVFALGGGVPPLGGL
jgi:hypothetical protein